MTDDDVSRRQKIVVLTPVYNESGALPYYEEKVRKILLDNKEFDFSVMFIEDGSDDNSWELIREICAKDNRFEGICLSRNFGSHIALTAGFDRTQADAYAILPCDLQDPPETVLEFVELWKQDYQIVWGDRRSRKDPLWRKVTSNIFGTFARKFVMPKGSSFSTGSFLLADNLVVENYRKFREHSRATFALFAWTGFRQVQVDYDRSDRVAGKSGWNLRRMIKAMYDVFIGFSQLPIQIVSASGVAVFILSILLTVFLTLNWLLGTTAPGWTSIMLMLSMFFSVQFLLMGLLGQYLYRIFLEVAQRPLYFVSDSIDSGNSKRR